jgi:hypothetical protein
MICAMSPARNTPIAAEKWREFAAIVEEPHEPRCPICDIRHFRDKPGAPYCHMAQRFFLWCREPRAVTQAAMNEARTTALPRYATAKEMIEAMEREP